MNYVIFYLLPKHDMTEYDVLVRNIAGIPYAIFFSIWLTFKKEQKQPRKDLPAQDKVRESIESEIEKQTLKLIREFKGTPVNERFVDSEQVSVLRDHIQNKLYGDEVDRIEHTKRVRDLAIIISRNQEFTDEQKYTAEIAALLHDVSLTRGDSKNHSIESLDIIEKELISKGIKVPASVKLAVLHHQNSSKFPKGVDPELLGIVRILKMADLIDWSQRYEYLNKRDGSTSVIFGNTSLLYYIRLAYFQGSCSLDTKRILEDLIFEGDQQFFSIISEARRIESPVSNLYRDELFSHIKAGNSDMIIEYYNRTAQPHEHVWIKRYLEQFIEEFNLDPAQDILNRLDPDTVLVNSLIEKTWQGILDLVHDPEDMDEESRRMLVDKLYSLWDYMDFYVYGTVMPGSYTFFLNIRDEMSEVETGIQREIMKGTLKPFIDMLGRKGYLDWAGYFNRALGIKTPEPVLENVTTADLDDVRDSDVIFIGEAHTSLSTKAYLKELLRDLDVDMVLVEGSQIQQQELEREGLEDPVKIVSPRQHGIDGLNPARLVYRNIRDDDIQIDYIDYSPGKLYEIIKEHAPEIAGSLISSQGVIPRDVLLRADIPDFILLNMRNEYMSETIKKKIENNPGKKIAILCGSDHLRYPAGESLPERLEKERMGVTINSLILENTDVHDSVRMRPASDNMKYDKILNRKPMSYLNNLYVPSKYLTILKKYFSDSDVLMRINTIKKDKLAELSERKRSTDRMQAAVQESASAEPGSRAIRLSDEFMKKVHKYSLGKMTSERIIDLDLSGALKQPNGIEKAVELLIDQDASVVKAAGTAARRGEIEWLTDKFEDVLSRDGRIIFIGCGAKLREAVFYEREWKNFNKKLDKGIKRFFPEKIEDFIAGDGAGGDRATFRSVEGMEDNGKVSEAELEALIKEYKKAGVTGPILVVSHDGSGNSLYSVRAVQKAVELGGEAVYLLNNPAHEAETVPRIRDVMYNSAIKTIHLNTDPPPIAGSTRLQPTTAGMVVLGAALSGALGRVYPEYENIIFPGEDAYKKISDWMEVLRDLIPELARFVDLKSSVYRENPVFSGDEYQKERGYLTFLSGSRAFLQILTNEVEEYPTFGTPPYASVKELKEGAPLSPSGVLVDAADPDEALNYLFGRDPRGVELKDLFSEAELLKMYGSAQAVPVLGKDAIRGYHFDHKSVSDLRPMGEGNMAAVMLMGDDVLEFNNTDSALRKKFDEAREKGAKTAIIAVTHHKVDTKKEWPAADIKILVPVGDDALSVGQSVVLKMLLNIQSNVTMAKVNKIYKNLMLDVSPSNGKLIDRSTRFVVDMLRRISDIEIDYRTANQHVFDALEFIRSEQLSGRIPSLPVKLAIVRIAKKITLKDADKLIKSNSGDLDAIFENEDKKPVSEADPEKLQRPEPKEFIDKTEILKTVYIAHSGTESNLMNNALFDIDGLKSDYPHYGEAVSLIREHIVDKKIKINFFRPDMDEEFMNAFDLYRVLVVKPESGTIWINSSFWENAVHYKGFTEAKMRKMHLRIVTLLSEAAKQLEFYENNKDIVDSSEMDRRMNIHSDLYVSEVFRDFKTKALAEFISMVSVEDG
ncbi:HD domain-containing protein, partial [Elusimicrobiota bacterium]